MKRGLAGTFTGAVLFTAVVGVAHTSVGRPLRPILGFLGRHGVAAGSCPLGYDTAANPQEREAARAQFAASHRGESTASSRFAAGFTLDVTTEADVMSWSHARGVTCERTGKPSHSDVECNDLPAAAFSDAGPQKRTLWLNFAPKGTLVSIVVIGKDKTAEVVTREYGSATMRAAASGPAYLADADASTHMLEGGLLRQAHAEYRFRDYYVLVRESNMGAQGYMVHRGVQVTPTLAMTRT